jgi:hypothetical protein
LRACAIHERALPAVSTPLTLPTWPSSLRRAESRVQARLLRACFSREASSSRAGGTDETRTGVVQEGGTEGALPAGGGGSSGSWTGGGAVLPASAAWSTGFRDSATTWCRDACWSITSEAYCAVAFFFSR